MGTRILVITGPTASGKTAISIEMAKRFHGEIISADSRQVYRGLDIGTAKVRPEEMQGIPHHLIDIRDPGETYSVADFQRDAQKLIDEITVRGKLPIVVGGTFLYIKALISNYQFLISNKPDTVLREELLRLTADGLRQRLKRLDPNALTQIDINNPRRLIRAIEQITSTGKPLSEFRQREPSPYNTLMIALNLPRAELYKHIDTRIDARMKAGMLEEVQRLITPPSPSLSKRGIRGGVSHEWLRGLGLEYRFLLDYTRLCKDEALPRLRSTGLSDTLQKLKYASHAFARRQLTWLRREKTARWVEPNLDKIEKLVTTWLSGSQ